MKNAGNQPSPLRNQNPRVSVLRVSKLVGVLTWVPTCIAHTIRLSVAMKIDNSRLADIAVLTDRCVPAIQSEIGITRADFSRRDRSCRRIWIPGNHVE